MAGKLFDLTQFQRHRIGRQRLPAPGIFCHRRVTKLPIQSKVRAAEPSKAARAKITWLAPPLELENSVVIICFYAALFDCFPHLTPYYERKESHSLLLLGREGLRSVNVIIAQR